jgi:hypothetical protein
MLLLLQLPSAEVTGPEWHADLPVPVLNDGMVELLFITGWELDDDHLARAPRWFFAMRDASGGLLVERPISARLMITSLAVLQTESARQRDFRSRLRAATHVQ